MTPPLENAALRFSQRVYQRCLWLYPQAHRAKYGGTMSQLFRDQCREAWRKHAWRGLAAVWLRAVPDLCQTAVAEHLSSIREPESKPGRLASILKTQSTSPALMVRIALAAFVPLVGVALVVMVGFLQPKTYTSESRLLVRWVIPEDPIAGQPVKDPAALYRINRLMMEREIRLMQSDAVLERVLQRQRSNTTESKFQDRGQGSPTREALARLRWQLQVSSAPESGIIQLRVTSGSAKDAARLANALVETYLAQTREAADPKLRQLTSALDAPGLKVEGPDSELPRVYAVSLIQQPTLGERTIRPNFLRNLPPGGVGGPLISLLAGGGIVLLAHRTAQRRSSRIPALKLICVPANGQRST